MSDYSKFKILVVDDDDDVRDYLQSALEDYEFQVETATDGLEALESVKKDLPDLISLDLVMPKHSGAKCFRELQKNKEWAKIPVLIVTGHARDDKGKVDFENMMMQGPGVYLEKPVKPKNYIEKICYLLEIDPPEDIKKEPKEDKESLKSRLSESLKDADSDALKKALDILNKKNK